MYPPSLPEPVRHLSLPADRARGMATAGKLVLLAVVAGLVAAFFVLDLGQYANLDYLKSVRGAALDYVAENPVQASLGYFIVYVLVTGLSLPGAAIMTLAGGAIFGLGWGLLLVSFASTAGATIAMLISRTLLRDWVQGRFGAQLVAINEGLEKDGEFYLFGLRMVPLFPFFVINLVMGLTPMRAWSFYWVSQLGMLAGTVVFVFAGTQLAEVSSLGDILSPGLIIAFSLLGLFPIIARKTLGWMQDWRARRRPAAATPEEHS
ncbi:MAG: TVP38/TMEM64 family protein [Pseudomonadota bacterium]